MLRLNRLSSAGNILAALFTATTSPKQFSRPIPPLRSLVLKHIHSSRHRTMDPVSSTAANGIDGYIHLEKGDRISGEKHETVPENYGGDNNSYERKVLPPELSKSAVTLACDSSASGGVCDVYLVGTTRDSVESCKEVQAVIDFLKPQVVFLELCAGRVYVLAPHNFKVIEEMLEGWKKNQYSFWTLCKWCFAKVCIKHGLIRSSESEFRVAYKEAVKYGGKVILGDRSIDITGRRTWAKTPLWHFAKLLVCYLMFSEKKFNKMMKETGEEDFPTIMETIVHERDQYMSAKLLKIAKQHNSVVAVVRRIHLPGIKKNWKQHVDYAQMKEILRIPSPKRAITKGKILGTIGVVSIISGLYLSIKK